MTEELLTRMASASHLLPDPGGEVVRECLAEISRLRSENEELKEENRLVTEQNKAMNEALKTVRADTIREVAEFLKLAEMVDGSSHYWSEYVLLMLKADKIAEGG